MANYLVINLADRSGMGAISSLHAGVSAKHLTTGLTKLIKGSNTTTLVDAFALFDRDLLKQLPRSDPALLALRNQCRAADKIYLATHGIPTDVDHAFANAAGGNPLCTVSQLASFLLAILPQRDKTYRLALVMCYGARSATYRHADLDHQGNIPIADLRTSFAYKLYSRLAQHRNIVLTARTGAVAYDSHSGISRVEDELSIDARIDKELFLRQPNIVPTVNAFKARRDAAAKAGNQAYDAFVQLQEQFEKDPNKVPANPVETDLKHYTDMMRTKKQYQDVMDANTDRAKYGKIFYRLHNGQLTIASKYADQGRPLILYTGPMVYD